MSIINIILFYFRVALHLTQQKRHINFQSHTNSIEMHIISGISLECLESRLNYSHQVLTRTHTVWKEFLQQAINLRAAIFLANIETSSHKYLLGS